MRRVVITGLGIVAPTGNNVEDAWAAAVEGRSGVSRISCFDPSALKVQIAAEVKNLGSVPGWFSDAKDERRMSRFVLFAASAAYQAMKDSGLKVEKNPERYGCIVGVGIGGLADIEENAF